MRFAEETLMAYADAELDDDTRADVEAMMATDSDLADAIALQLENRAALKERLHAQFASALYEPIPEQLLLASEPDEVSAPIEPSATDATETAVEAHAQKPRWSLREWSAFLAIFAVGVLIGYFALQRDTAPIVTNGGRMTAASELRDALAEQAGGVLNRETGIQIGVSYLAKNGEYCRTFTLKDGNVLAGLACRRQAGWAIDLLTHTSANASGAYRMAGAAVPPIILSVVETTIAGDPLDPEAEAEARARGWQR